MAYHHRQPTSLLPSSGLFFSPEEHTDPGSLTPHLSVDMMVPAGMMFPGAHDSMFEEEEEGGSEREASEGTEGSCGGAGTGAPTAGADDMADTTDMELTPPQKSWMPTVVTPSHREDGGRRIADQARSVGTVLWQYVRETHKGHGPCKENGNGVVRPCPHPPQAFPARPQSHGHPRSSSPLLPTPLPDM